MFQYAMPVITFSKDIFIVEAEAVKCAAHLRKHSVNGIKYNIAFVCLLGVRYASFL